MNLKKGEIPTEPNKPDHGSVPVVTEGDLAEVELEDAIRKFQEHGKLLTFVHVIKIIGSVRLGILLALLSVVVSILITSFTIGQRLPNFPDFGSGKKDTGRAALTERIKPKGFLDYISSSAHLDTREWVIPLVQKLESESSSEPVYGVTTTAFDHATTSFVLIATAGRSVYAFRVHTEEASGSLRSLYEPLSVTSQPLRIHVPECDKGDSIFLIIQLNPSNTSDIKGSLQLRMEP